MFAYDLCVVGGCGRVGLPLSLAFAACGKKVLIHDVDTAAMKMVRAGRMPFLEKGTDAILRRELGRNLFLARDAGDIARARFVVITIGTPVREDAAPEIDLVQEFMAALLPRLEDGQILILRSTLYPGTTDACRDLVRRSGRDLQITFCPERISEGNSLEELSSLPQIVSGYSREALEQISALFRQLTPVILELTPREAELTKLFSNAYRYIHFSIANRFCTLATERGLDYGRMHHALTEGYPRNRSLPQPGFVGGPCLYKDTAYLTHFFGDFELGREAIRINENVVESAVNTLRRDPALATKTVGILGMAFKPESDDVRNSKAVELAERIRPHCREVLCTDEYAPEYSILRAEDVIARADCIVIGCAHKHYSGLEFGSMNAGRISDADRISMQAASHFEAAETTRLHPAGLT